MISSHQASLKLHFKNTRQSKNDNVALSSLIMRLTLLSTCSAGQLEVGTLNALGNTKVQFSGNTLAI